MELKQVCEDVFYIPNATNLGVIVKDSHAILIDSGLDDDTGKKVLQTLEKAGLHLDAIINTHSHADHIGGNSYLSAKTGAQIYSPDYEAAIIHYPYLEPFFLFSGANPIKDLKNKFLMAKPSKVDYVLPQGRIELDTMGLCLNIIPLPGHALNQAGVGYNGALFCADSVFSIDVLDKHKIPFCVDIHKQLETLDLLCQSDYSLYIPSHAAPTDNISSMADAYRKTVAQLENIILSLTEEPKSTEDILSSLCCQLGVEIKGAQQFYLLKTSVMAYLSYIYEKDRLNIQMIENRLLWKKN